MKDQWLLVGQLKKPRAMMQIVEQSGMILISGQRSMDRKNDPRGPWIPASGGTSQWLEIWEIDDIGVLSHDAKGVGSR